ncbi:DUF4328 domain-containing protein [Pseudonocardia sp. GCM10023141]|uniref:DUF4328 domain-containing protein n=1 Tax=Pseudonocardia sp. GCM10023141 TaxID=3252653 RepID=UPI00361874D4
MNDETARAGVDTAGAAPVIAGAGLRSVRGWGMVAIAAMAAVVLLRTVDVVRDWSTYAGARTLVASGIGALRQSQLSELRSQTVFLLLTLLVVIPAVIAFPVWTARARGNAELISARPHRRTRGWAVGSWFVPVANIWLPKIVIEDIWLASDPATRSLPAGVGPRSVSGVTAWWGMLVALFVVYVVGSIAIPRPVVTYGASGAVIDGAAAFTSAALGVAVVNTVLVALSGVALWFAVGVISQVGRWQEDCLTAR